MRVRVHYFTFLTALFSAEGHADGFRPQDVDDPQGIFQAVRFDFARIAAGLQSMFCMKPVIVADRVAGGRADFQVTSTHGAFLSHVALDSATPSAFASEDSPCNHRRQMERNCDL